MPIVTEDREAVHIERWRVGVCDQCGKRVDISPVTDLQSYRPVPVNWVTVYEGPGPDPTLVFCSTACLKAYP